MLQETKQVEVRHFLSKASNPSWTRRVDNSSGTWALNKNPPLPGNQWPVPLKVVRMWIKLYWNSRISNDGFSLLSSVWFKQTSVSEAESKSACDCDSKPALRAIYQEAEYAWWHSNQRPYIFRSDVTPESLPPIAVMNVSWDLVVMNIFVRILYVHIKIMESSTERTFKFTLQASRC